MLKLITLKVICDEGIASLHWKPLRYKQLSLAPEGTHNFYFGIGNTEVYDLFAKK